MITEKFVKTINEALDNNKVQVIVVDEEVKGEYTGTHVFIETKNNHTDTYINQFYDEDDNTFWKHYLEDVRNCLIWYSNSGEIQRDFIAPLAKYTGTNMSFFKAT